MPLKISRVERSMLDKFIVAQSPHVDEEVRTLRYRLRIAVNWKDCYRLGIVWCEESLSLLNRGIVEARWCEFWRGIILPIGIDELVRCHVEDTSRHSGRTETVYDKWIPSNDVFEKCEASAICASVWR
ncbi:hypothetical protein TNCV_2689671 [Trichonephila clavipes]|uniref:Uncharacterized protein n=1 Tax=Trichonephila clavipes TaxID=2585209 RepID=A0A8X6VYR6_TRICX|nr:hypothetical protein TNCV_2689671 [Trichonephila clavipes]